MSIGLFSKSSQDALITRGERFLTSHPAIPQSVEQFCNITEPYQAVDEEVFVQAMRDLTIWHQERNAWYRDYLQQHHIDAHSMQTLADVIDLPPIHANFLKTHEIKSVADDEVALHLTSSGTTGQKSQVFFDEFTISHARRMAHDAMSARGLFSTEPANYLVNAFEPFSGFKVGTSNTNQFLMGFAPVAQQFWSLRLVAEGKHEYDAFGTVAALQAFAEAKEPTRIIGFPAFLHFALERMRLLQLQPLKLPENSWVVFGGGWKGHADQAISKEQLLQNIEHWLGIPASHVIETFGSVEHSIPYVGCAEQHLHVPVWSKVIIRDVKTMRPVTDGEAGFLSFVSPYITSAPVHSVVMGDLARLHPENSCVCGNPTAWFEVLGRAGTSSNKSCAAAAAEVLPRQ